MRHRRVPCGGWAEVQGRDNYSIGNCEYGENSTLQAKHGRVAATRVRRAQTVRSPRFVSEFPCEVPSNTDATAVLGERG